MLGVLLEALEADPRPTCWGKGRLAWLLSLSLVFAKKTECFK
jgi:hypothetical protein